jgi:hypothetical protein
MSDQNNGQSREEQRTRPFNPNEHVMQIRNRNGAVDYLPVQWRLVWFRNECPHGTIDTEEVEVDLDREMEEEVYVWNNEKRRSEKVVKRAKGYARFKATITDGKGGRATGTKSESAASFPDYIEKAETGAIGRALAALGYGTQFAPELNEEHRIVDSPVERSVPAVESGFGGNSQSASASTNGNVIGAARKPVVSAVRPVPTSGVGKANGNGSGLHAVTPAAGGEAESEEAAATEQQLTSIRKLCERLGKPEPENPDALSFTGAKELIGQLTQEYRSRKAS